MQTLTDFLEPPVSLWKYRRLFLAPLVRQSLHFIQLLQKSPSNQSRQCYQSLLAGLHPTSGYVLQNYVVSYLCWTLHIEHWFCPHLIHFLQKGWVNLTNWPRYFLNFRLSYLEGTLINPGYFCRYFCALFARCSPRFLCCFRPNQHPLENWCSPAVTHSVELTSFYRCTLE